MASAPVFRPDPRKKILRVEVLSRRQALGAEARLRASARIAERVLALPAFLEARGVHGFISLPDEVDTAPLLAACARQGKAVYLPYQLDGRRLGCAQWQPGSSLVTGPFGVQEPPPWARTAVDLAAIDLVLVPGVAFDRRGNRLGYGKGYYDFFLKELLEARRAAGAGGQPGAALVALAFHAQLVPEVPVDPWDLPIFTILTEEEQIEAPASNPGQPPQGGRA